MEAPPGQSPVVDRQFFPRCQGPRGRDSVVLGTGRAGSGGVVAAVIPSPRRRRALPAGVPHQGVAAALCVWLGGVRYEEG